MCQDRNGKPASRRSPSRTRRSTCSRGRARVEVSRSGAFDITFYALHGLWKFDEDLDPNLPDPSEVKAAQQLIDWRQLIVDRVK